MAIEYNRWYFEEEFQKYINWIQQGRPKFEKDKTFSDQDLIRIYHHNLTEEEMYKVKNYFEEMLSHVVVDSINAFSMSLSAETTFAKKELEFRRANYITLRDLIFKTLDVLYELYGIASDFISLDFSRVNRVVPLYLEGVVLVNNWYRYYQRVTDWPSSSSTELWEETPWWFIF